MKKIPKISKGKNQIADRNELIVTSILNNKIKKLKNCLIDSISKEPIVIDCEDISENCKYTIFLSVCDGKSRARVCHSTGSNFDEAWNTVVNMINVVVKKYKINPLWIKADIVDVVSKLHYKDVKEIFLAVRYQKFFRKGFSLDSEMKMAFLESEANSYKLYDYSLIPTSSSKPGYDKVPWINIKQVINYLEWNDRKDFPFIEPNVYFFDCRSFLAESDNNIVELYKYGLNCGRRVTEELTEGLVKEIISTSSLHLNRQLQQDGRFIYGYYPSFNSVMKSYNILRHAGTTWAMMCAYDVTKDITIKETICRTIEYLLSQIIYKEDKAYLLEQKSEEFKLGGIGIAILTLSKYMETFKDKDYSEIICKLANSIISLQNQKTGKMTHVLNSNDFSVKEEFRTVYYDGESSYALIKAFEISGNERYLDAARRSIDFFVENNYIQYRDHWIAYALNEFTKYVQDEKYYEFALRNAWDNRIKIRDQATSYHTYLELLMETYELFLRLKKENITFDYMNMIDEEEFVEIINHRAWHMLDGYFYPEYAMYMSRPDTVLGSFFVRHDGFRARIDDNQHFIDGYAKYYKIFFEAKE